MENSIVNQKTKSSNIEAFIFLGILLFGFSYVANIMGAGIMFKVIIISLHNIGTFVPIENSTYRIIINPIIVMTGLILLFFYSSFINCSAFFLKSFNVPSFDI